MDNEKAIKILRKGYPDINRYAASELEDYEYDVETYNEAVSYAISHLEADRWRPISEPPKEHDYYLVTCEFGVARATDIALFYPDRKGEEQWSLTYVTAWKPLPEPYESEVTND